MHTLHIIYIYCTCIMYTQPIKYTVFHWYHLFFKPPTHSTLLKGTSIPGSQSSGRSEAGFSKWTFKGSGKTLRSPLWIRIYNSVPWRVFFFKKKNGFTPLKNNIEPENDWLEDDFPLPGKIGVQGQGSHLKRKVKKKKKNKHHPIHFSLLSSLWGKLIWKMFLVGFKILWKKPSESRHVFSWLNKIPGHATPGP